MQTSWNRSVLLILLPFMACLLGISANAGTHASKKTATHKTVSKRSSPAVEAALRRSIRQSALAQRIESSEKIEIGRAAWREECVSTCRSGGSPYHSKKKKNN